MVSRSTLSILVLLLVLSGCTVKAAVETPAPSPFLDHPELLHKPEHTPFDLAWLKEGAAYWQYNVLEVAAVRSNQVSSDSWAGSAGVLIPGRRNYIHRVNRLAEYIQESVIKHFQEAAPEGAMLTVEKGEPIEELRSDWLLDVLNPPEDPPPLETLVQPKRRLELQISISDVHFGDPLIYGGLLAVPVPAAANLSTAAKSPSLTLEAKFIDDQTGEVIAELLDRRFPQIKVIDLNRLTIYRALKDLADSFAKDLAAAFFREGDEEVSRRLPISLIPW